MCIFERKHNCSQDYPSPLATVLQSPMEKPSPGCFPAEPHARRNLMFPNGFSGIHCHEESPSNISTLAFLLHVRSRTFKISAVCRYPWLPWVASSLHLVKARMSPPQETAPIIPSLSLIHHGTLESYLMSLGFCFLFCQRRATSPQASLTFYGV